ncbi:MAG: sugar ABC transporter permease [Verrucomicrobia bacterium]|nr:sugar ABC transporter permease [Verrucomicrobiota bacterium]
MPIAEITGNRPGIEGIGSSVTRRVGSEGAVGWSLVSPAVAILLLMTVAPTIYLLQSSFFSFTLLNPELKRFVGLQNFVQVVLDPTIRQDILVTLLFVILAVGIELLVGLILAVALAPRSFGNTIGSTILLLPFAVTPVVSALIWRQLLNPNYGWIDYYLQRLGIIGRPIEWLSSAPTAWAAIVGLDVWQWTPFVALILMAGLQGIPREPQEAAAVDGANSWQTFWHVTLPQLRPFIALAVLLRLVEAFKTFGTVQILTGGGPGRSTELINLTLYRVGLQDFQIGAAAALGILFLILLSMIVSQLLKVLGRNTELLQ